MKPLSLADSALVVAAACALFLLGSCASHNVTDTPPSPPPVKEISPEEEAASRQVKDCLDFHRELDAKYKLGETFSDLDLSEDRDRALRELGSFVSRYARDFRIYCERNDLPEDFRSACLNHAAALRKLSVSVADSPSAPDGLVESIGALVSGDTQQIVAFYETVTSPLLECAGTWESVLECANRYKVTKP